MNYILFGDQPIFTKLMLQKLIADQIGEINDFNYAYYDATKTLMDEIVEESSYMPFGVNKRMIVIDNAYFLGTAQSKKGPSNNKFDNLLAFISKPSEMINLVFVVETSKLDNRSKLSKTIQEHAKVYEIRNITEKEWPEYIKRSLARRDVTITNEAASELALRVAGDAQLFESEANKLATYASHITLDIVKDLVPRSQVEKSYELTNALLDKNLNRVLEIYYDFKKVGQEPTTFITMIANQFRLYSQVFILHSQGKGEAQITDAIGVHPYRVKLALQVYRKGGIEEVNNVLEQLYELDYKIKSGQVDRFYAFELFLVNYCKN